MVSGRNDHALTIDNDRLFYMMKCTYIQIYYPGLRYFKQKSFLIGLRGVNSCKFNLNNQFADRQARINSSNS